MERRTADVAESSTSNEVVPHEPLASNDGRSPSTISFVPSPSTSAAPASSIAWSIRPRPVWTSVGAPASSRTSMPTTIACPVPGAFIGLVPISANRSSPRPTSQRASRSSRSRSTSSTVILSQELARRRIDRRAMVGVSRSCVEDEQHRGGPLRGTVRRAEDGHVGHGRLESARHRGRSGAGAQPERRPTARAMPSTAAHDGRAWRSVRSGHGSLSRAIVPLPARSAARC